MSHLAWWLYRRCHARTVRNGHRIRCHLPRRHVGRHQGWVDYAVLVNWDRP